MFNLLESPNEDPKGEAYDSSHDETPEERREREMMDAMINGYHSRLEVPDYILYEADGLD
jgi:hypothetical protein